jgi:hypothetical protein
MSSDSSIKNETALKAIFIAPLNIGRCNFLITEGLTRNANENGAVNSGSNVVVYESPKPRRTHKMR